MSPRLTLSALADALSLSACYYVTYGYYPAHPGYPGTPVVSTAQTQREIQVALAEPSGDGYVQNYPSANNTPPTNSAYSSTTPQYFAVVATAPVVYTPYPAYYPAYYPAIRFTHHIWRITAATVIPPTVTVLRYRSASAGVLVTEIIVAKRVLQS
jgi:hypothetical protein